MAYNTKYKIEFDTVKGRSIKIDIEEDAFAGSITNLTASGDMPLEISYPDGEFDKMCGIRESRLRIKVISNNINTDDLLITSDTQYKVKVYVNNNVEWVGWLDNDYITEQFLDTTNEIELSASDGLSLIKSIELADLSDNEVWGIYKVKEFIAYALDKTELGLDYWSFINMYPVGALQRGVVGDYDAFFYSNITSHTFIRGPREFDDCYTVLSKIMQAYGCTLFQARGAWYILQTNDRIAGDLDGNRRNSSGTFQQTVLNQNFSIDIGLDKVTKLINADALTSWEKEFKETVIKYSFKMPPIFFRNWDLLDGTFNAPLSTSTRQVYDLSYWEAVPAFLGTWLNEGFIGVDIDTTTNAELRRYLLLYTVANTSTHKAVKSTDYYVNQNDVLSFSYSTREKNARFNASVQWNFVVLEASNGDFYTLGTNGAWSLNVIKRIGYGWNNTEDRRFWKEFNIEAQPFPVNGKLYVVFTSYQNPGSVNLLGEQVYYKDLTVDIENYFNEMLTVDGYEYKNSQVNELKNLYDNEIFLSKSDNIGTQGAILANDYTQLNNWKYYNANDNTAVNFAKYIARGYWRAMYRNFQRMEGRLYDLYQGDRLISPLNTVIFSAIDDKEFMITTLNIDVRNEEAEFTMVELRNTANNNDFTEVGTEAFTYLNVKAQNYDDIIKEPRTPIDWKYGTLGIVNSLLRRNKRRRFNNYS